MQIYGIDEKDNEIINLLLGDGRMSYSDIGAQVGLTRVAVKNRIKSLENAGIIKGYQAVVNPQATPQMITFILNAEAKPECFEGVKIALAEAPEVATLIQTTGQCHLMAVCLLPNIKDMRDFANRIYKEVEGIHSINVHTVLDILKGNIISNL